MDAITKQKLHNLSEKYPGKNIYLTHQFLDGEIGKPCEFVPNNSTGETVGIEGKWWEPEVTPSSHLLLGIRTMLRRSASWMTNIKRKIFNRLF